MALAEPPAPTPPASQSQPAAVPPELTHFEEAILPPEIALQPGRYVVTLALTISESGAVTEVAVKGAAHPALAALARDAARRFRFRPATVGGTPVPVHIAYRYVFDVRPRPRVVVYVFTVRQKASREPIDGVTALCEENGRSFTSTAGRLEVTDLPPGRYTLYVPEGEFAELRVLFEVAAGAVGQQRIYLERRTGVSHQTVIRAPAEARYVAKQSLETAELQRLPGSGGDPIKMVENMPGVPRPSSFNLGSSDASQYTFLLNSLPLRQLYHVGGLYSVIHPDFVERIDFVPAGFDAGYGRTIGSIVDVRLREEPLRAFHGAFDVNLIHASVIAGAPYSSDGDLQVAFRRSYIDAILKGVMPSGDDLSLTTAPRYYDYQVKWQHRFGSRHRLLLFANGTDDALELLFRRANLDDPSFVGKTGLDTYAHGLMARWTFEPSPVVRNDLALQGSINDSAWDFFQAARIHTRKYPLFLRDDLAWRMGPSLRLHLGVEGLVEKLWFDNHSPEAPAEGRLDTPFSLQEIIDAEERHVEVAVSPFVSAEWQPLARLTLVPSVRTELWRGARSWTYVDPRLAARVQATDRLSLRLAGGLYHQPPSDNAWSNAYGNPRLGPEGAIHLLGGAAVELTEYLTVSEDLFYEWLFDLAEPTADRTLRYTNAGKGRTYGSNFLLRLRPGGRFFGWIAYTYIRQERYDFDRQHYRPSDYDQRHMLNVLGSCRLPRHWSVGLRFRLASGYPYTPVVGATFDADSDRFSPVPSPNVNSARMPAFHALDVRADKEWLFDTWKLALYLELQNVYYHANVEGATYNYDYTAQKYTYGLPILPVIGLRGEL